MKAPRLLCLAAAVVIVLALVGSRQQWYTGQVRAQLPDLPTEDSVVPQSPTYSLSRHCKALKTESTSSGSPVDDARWRALGCDKSVDPLDTFLRRWLGEGCKTLASCSSVRDQVHSLFALNCLPSTNSKTLASSCSSVMDQPGYRELSPHQQGKGSMQHT
jgi:hypothetical protein